LCQDLFEQTFEQFNDENLEKIEVALETQGLEKVLQEEEATSPSVELDDGPLTNSSNHNPTMARSNSTKSKK
jgi:hypothetical protein